jgi:hypothetical protein
MRRGERLKNVVFDFDFGLLQIREVELDQVDGMRRILMKRLPLCYEC